MSKDFASADLTVGQLNALVKCLGGHSAVLNILRGVYTVVLSSAGFPIWKTIKLGTGLETADMFRRSLSSSGNKISEWADDVLNNSAFTTSKVEIDVNLVKVSVAELGFKTAACRQDVISRALQFGLELCPSEVGPQLRLEYPDQPKGESLTIGMKPITTEDGFRKAFGVTHHPDSELWHGKNEGKRVLTGDDASPSIFCSPEQRFVFVRPN